MTAPSSHTNLPPDRLEPVDDSDGLTEFSPERRSDPLPIQQRPAVYIRLPMLPDAVLGVDERTPAPNVGWKGLVRGAALVSAGLAIGAVAVAVLRMPPDLRPPPASAVTPSAAIPGRIDPAVIPAAPTPSSDAPERARTAPSQAQVPVVTSPSRPLSDRTTIELVLDRYRDTFNGLDVKDVYRTENQHVSFESCDIEIGSEQAEARCSGTARYVPRAGNGEPRIEARQWRFNLRRKDRDWVIGQVEAR